MKRHKLLPRLCLLVFIIASNTTIDQNRLKIVFFGDSITSEWATVDRVFAHRVPDLLEKEGLLCDPVISGTGSSHSGTIADNAVAKVRHGLERFESDVLAHNPDVVVIGFGANDAYIDGEDPSAKSRISIQKYESNLSYMIKTLQRRKISVILRTPSPFAFPEERMYQDVRLHQYAQVVRKLAKRYKTGLSDDYRLFKDYGAEHGGYSRFFPDGVHPNDEGHALIAQNVANEILKTIHKSQKK